jgi:hypothetical protein
VGKLERHVDDLLKAVPVGTILAWDPYEREPGGKRTGERRTLPEGWSVCSGQNGTPDLRNLFLQGAIADTETGAPKSNSKEVQAMAAGPGPFPDDWKDGAYRLAGDVPGAKLYYGRPKLDVTPPHYKVLFIMKIKALE